MAPLLLHLFGSMSWRRAIGGIFLLALLAGVLALSAVSFQRKVASFSQIHARVVSSDSGLAVVASSEPGLAAGDRILLIDGAPAPAMSDPAALLSRPPFPHHMAIIRRGAVVAATTYKPAVIWDTTYLFLTLTGIVYLLIGLVTLLRDRARTTLLFAAFCVCFFAIDLLTPSGPVDGMWKAIWLAEDVCRAFAPALLVNFFALFPKPVLRRRGLLYLPAALYLGAETLLTFSPALLPASKLPFAVELVERFWMIYFAAYAAGAVVLIARAVRGADATAERQARWIALGSVLGLLPFAFLYAIPRALGFYAAWAGAAGIIGLVFVPLGFAYAIARWRLWDVDIIAREAAAALAAVFLGIICFVAIDTLLNRALATFTAGTKNLAAYGSGIFLATLLVPVKRRISGAIERFQQGDSLRARRALLDFSREQRGQRDAPALARGLARSVGEAMDISPCRVILFGENLPTGISPLAIGEKLATEEFIPVRSATFPSGEDLTFLHLHEDGFRYLFALRPAGRLAGVLAAGNKENGRVPLSSEDTSLLCAVMSQASLAFENAELFQELNRRARESAEKERLASLGALAAGVAHEVNTPLAGISSYAQLLLADTVPEDPRYEVLKKMERQTFRAARLVSDLLAFARGRHQDARRPADLAKVLRDAIESSETALTSRRVYFVPSGLNAPMPLLANEGELEQVFVNLLVNARDAAPEDSTIWLTAVTVAGQWEVRVEDEGAGLSEETARRAFEPFFTTKEGGGTGLGLAIAREIVERHHGQITLSPRPGGGTAAIVRLPR